MLILVSNQSIKFDYSRLILVNRKQMFNSQLSSFPSNNRNLSGNSSERSNSDFELVSGGSQKISMESGSASPTEEGL